MIIFIIYQSVGYFLGYLVYKLYQQILRSYQKVNTGWLLVSVHTTAIPSRAFREGRWKTT